MEASARTTIVALQLKPGYTALICLDTKYIAGQMMLVRSFLAGMNMIATEPVANPFSTISQHVDFAAFVPLQVDTMLRDNNTTELDTLTCAIIGGAALSDALKEKLKKMRPSFFATYGMTETI